MNTNFFHYIWHNSKPEQIFILFLVVLSLPFYFASLDIPKRIVNNAIEGRAFESGSTTASLFSFEISLPDVLGGYTLLSFPGFELERLPYLFSLCGLFLALVLINGLFKAVINIRKGEVGERLLRKMRSDLYGLLMRLRPDELRTIKSAEAASMIKDEIEPIGGFAGDAFIQPAFLGAQALTALAFIMLQNVWLGMIALFVVLIQAFIIPRLRLKLISLGRQRQLESRKLAGQIGSSVEAGPAIQSFGSVPYLHHELESQLSKILIIRIAIFRWKFSIKFLNNLLAQVTPFFFYSIGGYYALTGELNVGQLIAVIVAYRDLPPPIKEMIDWDQRRNDIAVKYEQVCGQLVGRTLLPESTQGENLHTLKPALYLKGLQISDGATVWPKQPLSLRVPHGTRVAIVDENTGMKSNLVQAIGQQSGYRGEIEIGGKSAQLLSRAAASATLIYCGSDAALMPGSIRENVLLAARSAKMNDGGDGSDGAWLDFRLLGARDPFELDKSIVAVFDILDMGEDLYRFGLDVTGSQLGDESTLSRLVAARTEVHSRLERKGLLNRIELFDPVTYHVNSTVGENLLFGIATSAAWAESGIARNKVFLSTLRSAGLFSDLADMGVQVGETMLEMVGDLPPNHPAFERYSLVKNQDISELKERLERVRSHGVASRLMTSSAWFIELALRYCEERHRFGLLNAELASRIVSARSKFRTLIDKSHEGAVEFFDPQSFVRAAPVRDNLLFGRRRFGLPQVDQQILSVIREVLAAHGLDESIRRIGLEFDVGPGGRLLSPSQRAAVNLARCVIKQAPIVVLDNALANFPQQDRERITERLREALTDRTLISTASWDEALEYFDTVVMLTEGGTEAVVIHNSPELETSSGVRG